MASNPVSLSARAGKKKYLPTQIGRPPPARRNPLSHPQLEDLGRTAHEQEAEEVEAEVAVTEEERQHSYKQAARVTFAKGVRISGRKILAAKREKCVLFTPHVT